jgi:hypothetical protein
MMYASAVKQRARHSDFPAEKASILAILPVIQRELNFFLIGFLHIDVVCGENADRFFELEDPDRHWFIALGDARVFASFHFTTRMGLA